MSSNARGGLFCRECFGDPGLARMAAELPGWRGYLPELRHCVDLARPGAGIERMSLDPAAPAGQPPPVWSDIYVFL